MRFRSIKCFAAALMVAVVPFATAGTPLVCFPYDIGDAPSLPWIADGGTGHGRGDYDTGRLVADTLALLGEQTPVIVRMETIRRAALYAGKDDAAGRQLLERLRDRSQAASGSGRALALFDYGYLVETLKQAVGSKTRTGAMAAAVNGYDFICRASAARGEDPEMEFAAAKVSAWPRQAGYETHLQKAAAGANNDRLLATNLRLQFPSMSIPGNSGMRAEITRKK